MAITGEQTRNSALTRLRVRVVSLLVDVCDKESILSRVSNIVAARKVGYVCFSTVHMVMESNDDPMYAAKVNGADLVIPDGMPLVWMQKLQGRRNAARTRANDMMGELCRYAEKENLSVGFYGGQQQVIDMIVERAAVDFPDLKVAYAFSPPFRTLTEDEDETVMQEINAASPDLLFMGLGCPKQENWMAANKGRLRCVMFGVGASFDFYAGNIKECPPWMGRVGLEWLFRLWQEPKRLWYRYLILNPRFVALATLQLLRLKKFE
ncbi:MAG: WecB/TagA/CpsF family glycosyltransferase [Blastocatellia bacterium]